MSRSKRSPSSRVCASLSGSLSAEPLATLRWRSLTLALPGRRGSAPQGAGSRLAWARPSPALQAVSRTAPKGLLPRGLFRRPPLRLSPLELREPGDRGSLEVASKSRPPLTPPPLIPTKGQNRPPACNRYQAVTSRCRPCQGVSPGQGPDPASRLDNGQVSAWRDFPEVFDGTHHHQGARD